MIFGEQMRDDVVLRLLEGQPNLETSKFLDRLMELSTLEEAERLETEAADKDVGDEEAAAEPEEDAEDAVADALDALGVSGRCPVVEGRSEVPT